MAKTTQRYKPQARRFWSNLTGDKKLTDVDRIMLFVLIGVVVVLGFAVYASRPPFQVS